MKLTFCLTVWILMLPAIAQENRYSLSSFLDYFDKGGVNIEDQVSQNYIKDFAAHNDPTIIRVMVNDVKRSGYNGEGRSVVYSYAIQDMYKENDRNKKEVLDALRSIIKIGSKEEISIADDFLADVEALDKGH